MGLGLVAQMVHGLWPRGDLDAVAYAELPYLLARSYWRWCAAGYFLGNYFMNIVARGVVHRLRTQVFDALIRVPKVVIDGYTHGELVSKLTFNVEQVSGASSEALKTIIRDGLTVLALIAYMLYLNWQLTLVFFAVTPAIAGVVLVVGRHFRRYSRRIQDSMGEVTQLSNESMHAFDEIRMFSASDQQSARFHAVSQFNRVQSLKLAFVQAYRRRLHKYCWRLPSPCSSGSRLTPRFWLDSRRARWWHSLLRRLSWASRFERSPMFRASFSEVLPPRKICLPRSTRLPRLTREHGIDRAQGHIVLENIGFSYPGDERRVLEGVSLTITAGQMVAFVGRSGAGKSSLMHLLCRFYAPTSGRIELDGKPIEAFRLADYRGRSRSSPSAWCYSVTLFAPMWGLANLTESTTRSSCRPWRRLRRGSL